MTKADFEARLKELTSAAETSLANHNFLIGQLAECRQTLAAWATREAEALEGELIHAAVTDEANSASAA